MLVADKRLAAEVELDLRLLKEEQERAEAKQRRR